MTFLTPTNLTKAYCNCLALERGLDPVGYAANFTDAVLVEIPLPWKVDMYTDAKVLPIEVIQLLDLWRQRFMEGHPYDHRPLAIAPDQEYSREGFRRVIFFKKPEGLFSQYQRSEYSVPVDQFGALVWALHEAPETLTDFEAYRLDRPQSVRDILVCTHGTVDTACAKFGYPLYRYMRQNFSNAETQIWRVSHFGGHVFAPTLMDMPTGHYWAYVEQAQADQIMDRLGPVDQLRNHYRGWGGIGNSFLQTLDFALWQEHGWGWMQTPKYGEVLTQDPDEQWADVRLQYAVTPDQIITVEARIEVTHTLETETNTGHDHTHAYPQYRVAHKTHTIG